MTLSFRPSNQGSHHAPHMCGFSCRFFWNCWYGGAQRAMFKTNTQWTMAQVTYITSFGQMYIFGVCHVSHSVHMYHCAFVWAGDLGVKVAVVVPWVPSPYHAAPDAFYFRFLGQRALYFICPCFHVYIISFVYNNAACTSLLSDSTCTYECSILWVKVSPQ